MLSVPLDIWRSGAAAVEVPVGKVPWSMPIVVAAPLVQATVTDPFASTGVVALATTGSYAPKVIPTVRNRSVGSHRCSDCKARCRCLCVGFIHHEKKDSKTKRERF